MIETALAAGGLSHLTDDQASAYLRQELAGVDATWVHPDIPPKKERNEQEQYRGPQCLNG